MEGNNAKRRKQEKHPESRLAQLLYDLSNHVVGCEEKEVYPLVKEALDVWAEANVKN